MSGVKTTNAVICAVLLAIAATPGAKAQTRKELPKQYERARRDCVNKFPTDIPKTIVAKVECLNAAQAVVLPTWGNNRDLIQTWMAYRAVIAERIQNKKMTAVEGATAIAQRWSETQTEIQRRNAYAALAGPQQNAAQNAVAQQNAATPGAKAQTQEELAKQYERAKRDCVNKFPTDIPKTIVAKVECLNTAQAVVLPTWGNNRDLIQTWMAYRVVIAERIQNKEMTVAEGDGAIAQRWSEAQTEIQRRNAYAAQAAAQQNAAQNAAVDAADRAKAAADPQTWVNTFQALRPAPAPAPPQ